MTVLAPGAPVGVAPGGHLAQGGNAEEELAYGNYHGARCRAATIADKVVADVTGRTLVLMHADIFRKLEVSVFRR